MADLVITEADVLKGSGTTSVTAGNAGEAITAGEVVYRGTDQKYYLAESGDTALKATGAGIALNTAEAADAPIDVLTAGELTLSAVMTEGVVYVISATAGGIAPHADLVSTEYVSILGVATAAATLSVKIHNSGAQIP